MGRSYVPQALVEAEELGAGNRVKYRSVVADTAGGFPALVRRKGPDQAAASAPGSERTNEARLLPIRK